MWQWLMSLDAPTRAALIGGGATIVSVLGALAGVYANLAWNRKQHRDEKSYSLRRDVYLDAIAIINRAVASLTRRCIPKLSDKEDKNGTDKIDEELVGACAKIHILGNKRLVAAVLGFEGLFGEWAKKLMQHQAFFDELSARLEANLKRVGNISGDVQKFTTAKTEALGFIKQFDPKNNDPETRKKLIAAADALKQLPARSAELQEQLNSMSTESKALTDERFQQISTSASYILKVQRDLLPLVQEIMIAMKSELGLTIDEAWYKAELKQALEESTRSAEDLIKSHPIIKMVEAKLQKEFVLNTD